jgi:hypothetical protein
LEAAKWAAIGDPAGSATRQATAAVAEAMSARITVLTTEIDGLRLRIHEAARSAARRHLS